DGKNILASGGNGQILLVPLSGPPRFRVLLKAPGVNNPDVSPDGRWLAYDSEESGVMEVWVRPFPGADDGRWQVSTSGGRQPVWSRDGRELFFLDREGFLTAVSVGSSAGFAASSPRRLLQNRYPSPGFNRAYDVSPDG